MQGSSKKVSASTRQGAALDITKKGAHQILRSKVERPGLTDLTKPNLCYYSAEMGQHYYEPGLVHNSLVSDPDRV